MFETILKKMGAMTPEWEATNIPKQEESVQTVPPVSLKKTTPTVQKTVTISLDDDTTIDTSEFSVTPTSSTKANTEMIQKIKNLLLKINKEGIDYIEVSNAAEQMDGGITPSNIKNAFIALKAGSGGKLTKEYVIETAQWYKEQIKIALDNDIKSKKAEKQKLVLSQSSEKESLQKSVDDLTKQLEELTKQKDEAEMSLSKIDSKYKIPIKNIDERINSGNSAVEVVISEIQSFVDIFTSVIK